MAEFVKFSMPEELRARQAMLLEKIKKSGKVKIGANEATKAAERGSAKLIVVAEDVSPPEIVMHLPLICREKNIPFSYVSTKKGLGQYVGIAVGTSAIAILDEGDQKKELADFAKKLQEIAKQ
ncbi:MAG: 50S ribosomal protein L7ae [Candidatus Diapherotrites archaeon]|uniref:50S ribosomal protein L7Ae n=1 Tax=Candidatus Iainarchaeum sp. TaxID=3101447 RepID=A0A8T3YLZ1_9ARCH|nr:50S ribosomal protein L7ae [Candidatus Diapherotrites archaeon]